LRRDDAHLLDILKAARLAIEFKGPAEKAEFLEDAKTQSATLHQLLIIGEAVKKNITGAQVMISSMYRPGSSSISSSNTTLLDSICNVAAMGPCWFSPSTRTPRS